MKDWADQNKWERLHRIFMILDSKLTSVVVMKGKAACNRTLKDLFTKEDIEQYHKEDMHYE